MDKKQSVYVCDVTNTCVNDTMRLSPMDGNGISVMPHERHGFSNQWQLDFLLNNLSDRQQTKYQSSASLNLCDAHQAVIWIPFTKSQLCGKIFHVLTLACNIGVIVMGSPSHSLEWGAQLINNDYRKLSDTRRTKSQNWNVSRLSLQLSLCNILKPSVKWRMKM